MRRGRQQRERQRGVALIHVLVMIVVVACIGTSMMKGSIVLHRDSARCLGEMQAAQAAEGALALARHRLQRNGDWTGSSGKIGTCRVLIEVERHDAKTWTVDVTATAFPQGELGPPVHRRLRESIGPEGAKRLSSR